MLQGNRYLVLELLWDEKHLELGGTRQPLCSWGRPCQKAALAWDSFRERGREREKEQRGRNLSLPPDSSHLPFPVGIPGSSAVGLVLAALNNQIKAFGFLLALEGPSSPPGWRHSSSRDVSRWDYQIA